MFGGGGLKSKMMRRMTGMPDLSGMAVWKAMAEISCIAGRAVAEETEEETKKEKKVTQRLIS